MRKKLLFVSPRFLFPATTGGQIRTSQILRGLLGNAFEITLLSPGSPPLVEQFSDDLRTVCDHFAYWPETKRNTLFEITRFRYLFSSLPIPIATDQSRAGRALVARYLAASPDLAVFDFPHSGVLSPPRLPVPGVMFTHNVEAEIFKRHVEVADHPLKRLMWQHQYQKMLQYESSVLKRFNQVIAVSSRDAEAFRGEYGVDDVAVVRTGVDLTFFDHKPPAPSNKVVFIGSMDWLANIDAIEHFMDRIWPAVADEIPQASMTVIGRNPPQHLIQRAKSLRLNWRFTGFVDDIRPYVGGASVCVIPLRVAGGTRIKAYESMAMGAPVVSTSIGVEGLPLQPGKHFLCADSPSDFSAAVVSLLRDNTRATEISIAARSYVERNFSFENAAREFETICLDSLIRGNHTPSTVSTTS